MSIRSHVRHSLRVSVAVGLAWITATTSLADSLTRTEALRIAQTYVAHEWKAAANNLRHGMDSTGVEVHTPDRAGGRGNPAADCWVAEEVNTGVAYKWGGFDTPERFDAGLRAGKAAGDVYTSEKRRKGGAAVSPDAVGIDCSGFISRCWRLSSKHSTSMLFGISRRLDSPADLQPADIMNTAEGHVLLFARWLDAAKTRALFYEAAPFSKTRATERTLADLLAAGYLPLRYRRIQD